MPDIKEHIAYLSQEIGARPAGTEEEQQAALYITEQFQKEAGLPANIEDFNGVGDPHLPSMICCGAAVVRLAVVDCARAEHHRGYRLPCSRRLVRGGIFG